MERKKHSNQKKKKDINEKKVKCHVSTEAIFSVFLMHETDQKYLYLCIQNYLIQNIINFDFILILT